MPDEEIGASRAEALARGLSRYMGGARCVNGHLGPRYTLTCNCVECQLLRATEHKLRERERFRQIRGAIR